MSQDTPQIDTPQTDTSHTIMSKEDQMHKIFNIAEKPIMEYMCYYYNNDETNLFIDGCNIPDYVEPVVLLPIPDHSDKFIKLNIESVPYDYKSNIIDSGLIQYKQVKDSVGFIIYCINQIFPIIYSQILKDNMNKSIHLEYDEENVTLYPHYVNQNKRLRNYLEEQLQNVISVKTIDPEIGMSRWDTFSDDMIDEWTNIYNIIQARLAVIPKESEDDVKMEHEINENNKKLMRLGIVCTECTFDELPAEFQDSLRTSTQFV